jgi:hypothetical protein
LMGALLKILVLIFLFKVAFIFIQTVE